METQNLIIIGSGPAGYTAAIYASRANLKPLLFEGLMAGGQPGGQLMLTTDVENYPGFPDGITGPEMMELFKKQAERFGTQLLRQDVDEVDFSKRPFKIKSDGREYLAKAVIIATGATAKWLNIPSEKALQGYGVSACATCDGAFFRNKDVVIVGGGDTAMEEANFLTRFASKVYLIHRREEFRASKIMVDRTRKNPKIEFILNSAIEEIKDVTAKKVTGVVLRNFKTNTTSELACQGVFVAIGHEPNVKLFKGAIDLDEKGYISLKKGTRTNIEGVFAAGDVADHVYRQAVTAAGSGCAAALDAERWLAEHE